MQIQCGFVSVALHVLLLLGINGNVDLVEANAKRSLEGIIPNTYHQSMQNKYSIIYAFFTANDLKVGTVMPIYLGGLYPSNVVPPLLPKQQAEAIPFSSSQLPSLLDFFGFARGSAQATAMEDTLKHCEIKAVDQEAAKFCATSLEEMLDFVGQAFGIDDPRYVRAKRTTPMTQESRNKLILQNYTITDLPREIPTSPKMVGCHMMPYPYAIFYCHFLHGENKMFEISLKGENGAEAKAITVCHMDTSHLDPDHVLFQFLGIKSGDVPVCHVFPSEDLVWLPPLNPQGNGEKSVINLKNVFDWLMEV